MKLKGKGTKFIWVTIFKSIHFDEFFMYYFSVFNVFLFHRNARDIEKQSKAVCKNNLLESCNMFLRSLYFRIIFLFPDSWCLCKRLQVIFIVVIIIIMAKNDFSFCNCHDTYFGFANYLQFRDKQLQLNYIWPTL